jgi:hypothetical protein
MMEWLRAGQAELQMAAFHSVVDIPPALSRAVTYFENVKLAAQTCPPEDRRIVLACLEDFRSKLLVFSSAMERSSAILRGYSRRVGVSFDEYCPGGGSVACSDPAFLNLSI